MRLRGFACMMCSMQTVGVSGVRVMRRLFMTARGVVRCSFLMMLRRMLVVFCGLCVMPVSGVSVRRFLGHVLSPCA
jgi:hypothetical protein